MKSKQIRGFPVINLEDGSMEGRIQELLINPEQKTIEGFLSGEKGFLKSKQQFISFSSVNSIGSDAVTVQIAEAETLEIPPNLEIFRDYSLIGKSVISNEGNFLARVLDYTFCLRTGKIQALLLHDIKGREPINMDVYLTIDGILNLGKDYVIADSNYTAYLAEESREQEEILEAAVEGEPFEQENGDTSHIGAAEGESKGKSAGQEAAGEKKSYQKKSSPGKEGAAHNGFEQFKETWSRVEQEVNRGSKHLARESKERMSQYIRHKKANYPVYDEQGSPLVQKGQIISDEIAAKAEAQGKTPQLFFAVVSEEIEESLNLIGDRISRMFR